MTSPMAVSPKYAKRTFTVGPGQEVQFELLSYGVALATMNPLYGLGFIQFSLDNGEYLPITYMPVRMPFQYINFRNIHPNQSFTFDVIFILNESTVLEGSFSSIYQQFNQELTISVVNTTITSSQNVLYGPYYIGTRSQARVVSTVTASSGSLAAINLANSDPSGNLYETFPIRVNSLNSIGTIDVDGYMLAPYVAVYISYSVPSGGSIGINTTLTVR